VTNTVPAKAKKHRTRAGAKPRAADLSRKLPNQKRAHRTLANIVDAAEKILTKDGIDGLTMRKVAGTARVSVGSAYEYFPSKQALLYRVYQTRLETRLRFFDEAFSEQGLQQSFAETFGVYLELQRQAGFPSRLDLELQYAIDRDDELSRMTRHYEDELSQRYVKIMRHYGSNWPDDQLMQLAKFAHQVDHVNLKLQRAARPNQRGLYGKMTTEFMFFLVRHCGGET